MKIRAVLEALNMKGIKEIYIWYHDFLKNLRFQQIMSLRFCCCGVAVAVVRIRTGLLYSDAQTKSKKSRSLERSILSITSFYKVALYMEL